ncbi:MAG: hypothetical protein WAT16_04730, partial [Saprospiraceae bacterium]
MLSIVDGRNCQFVNFFARDPRFVLNLYFKEYPVKPKWYNRSFRTRRNPDSANIEGDRRLQSNGAKAPLPMILNPITQFIIEVR